MNLDKHKGLFHIYLSPLKQILGNTLPVIVEDIYWAWLLDVHFTLFDHIKPFLIRDMCIYKSLSDLRTKSTS